MSNDVTEREVAAITDRLRILSYEAEEKELDLSKVEKEAARLWAEVIDGKLYKIAGMKSLADFMEEVQAPYTRGYVYNLADCARCQPVIERFDEIGAKSSIEIAKAYKQDKITWEQAAEIAEKAQGQKLTCPQVKELVKEAKEENAPDLSREQELLKEQEDLLTEKARINARLKEIRARLSDIESELSELVKG